jgi:hypothetical protein
MLTFYLFYFLSSFLGQLRSAWCRESIQRKIFGGPQKRQRRGNYCFKGGFWGIFFIFNVLYSTLLHLPPLRFDCAELTDAGIEPRTVATCALAQSDALTTRLDLIRTRLVRRKLFQVGLRIRIRMESSSFELLFQIQVFKWQFKRGNISVETTN